MYKLCAIDLDGTLLNSYGQISEENKLAIKKALNQKKEVVITTGRVIAAARSFAEEINANKYIICGNGSLLYDFQNEQILYNKFIDKQKVLQIIKVCEENSIYYNIYTESYTIAKSLNYNLIFYNHENQGKPDNQKTNIKLENDIYNYIKDHNDINVLKITISDEHEVIFGRIIRKLREINNIDVLEVAHMSRKIIKSGTKYHKLEYFYTEITSENVNKWNALEKLSEKLNIKANEIVSIGDNINDKEMIENSGLGIMMGNGADYLKEFADVVVSDNNRNGVAEAIEKYILDK